VVVSYSGVSLDLQLRKSRILIRLLWMYIQLNCEFSSALSKFRNFGGGGGGFNPPKPRWGCPNFYS
jgi:hypothetical protein